MAIKRVVNTEFWIDDKVVDLFSPEDKYFMLYLLTNPHTTQLGIYKLNAKVAAFELGYSVEAVKTLLERFENKYGLIRYSNETQEVAVKNYLKHSVIKGGKPVLDLLNKELSQVKNTKLIGYVFDQLKGKKNLNASVSQFVNTIVLNDYENENDNENDNENEESYHESYHESSATNPRKRKTEVTRHKYGTYQNVLLSDEDLDKLKKEFSADWESRIERLSEYIASTGKKYKNHLATIRSWARNDKSKQAEKRERPRQDDLDDLF